MTPIARLKKLNHHKLRGGARGMVAFKSGFKGAPLSVL
jgi:hypothetical protein